MFKMRINDIDKKIKATSKINKFNLLGWPQQE